jgi:hypothetical protein
MRMFSICFPHCKTVQKVGARHTLHVEEYVTINSAQNIGALSMYVKVAELFTETSSIIQR